MGETRPQLTISLLISNRIETIPRCLDSLRPIMDAIPCELILTDTSKNPEVHNLLLEYTDKVYEFEWCNDFAKARNLGLEKAKGEWFLFLDDDEWFADADALINFFQTGEYQAYDYANYKVRNFKDSQYVYYDDCWLARLFRIEEESHFIRKIHEQFAPIGQRGKNIPALVYHSGYIYETLEDRKTHFERNKKLLLDMIKEEPDNIYWWLQLTQEYSYADEQGALIKYCEECLERLSGVDTPYMNIQRGAFYTGLVSGCIRQKEYEKCVKYAKLALEDERTGIVLEAMMHLKLAEGYLFLDKIEEAKDGVFKYLRIADDVNLNAPEVMEQLAVFLAGEAFNKNNVEIAYAILICCDLKQGRTNALKAFYDKLGWTKPVVYTMGRIEEFLVDAMWTMQFEPIFAKITMDTLSRENLRKAFCREILSHKKDVHDEFLQRIYFIAKTMQDVIEGPKDNAIDFRRDLENYVLAVSAWYDFLESEDVVVSYENEAPAYIQAALAIGDFLELECQDTIAAFRKLKDTVNLLPEFAKGIGLFLEQLTGEGSKETNMLKIESVIENLNLLFSMNDYENAEKLIHGARNVPALYNDIVAIYDANISLNKGDFVQMWEAIRRGLKCNPKNYELYVLLGEYYLQNNPNQAYLCFENALFYCENDSDRIQIQAFIDELKATHEITVKNTSFIILSYNTLDFTRTCIESIRENTLSSSREIVVVDNASTDGSFEWLKAQDDIVLRANTENSGFPRGCNQGVEVAAKENDVFLLNSDTLVPPNALFWLRMGLYENDSVGATGSVTNFAANFQSIPFEDSSTENLLKYALANNIPQLYPYEEKLHLIGFALLIKRSVYDEVGDLDERFSPGNFEDNDYGIRVIKAGYKNIFCRNSFILHFGSKSFGKKAEAYAKLLATNAQKFAEKWNLNPTIYFETQPHVVNLIKENREEKFRVLDVGCACGATCAYVKGQFPNAEVYGIEMNREAADIASYITDTICADVETMDYPWEEESFDYIILSNVIEYLNMPEKTLRILCKFIKKGGHIIASIPSTDEYMKLFLEATEGEFPASKQELYKTDRCYIIKAKKLNLKKTFAKKIAVCVVTYNHPDVVDDVLEKSIKDYYDCGIDIYYYDSSEGDETEIVIKKYQNKGYDNLFYFKISSDIGPEEKIVKIFRGERLEKSYDYIWPVKDRVFCPRQTLEHILEEAEEEYDSIFLGVMNTGNQIQIGTTTYEDAVAFYRDWGWFATSLDVVIYNKKTLLTIFDEISFEERYAMSDKAHWHAYTHFFHQIAQVDNLRIRLLRDSQTGIINSPLGKSMWKKSVFEIWQDAWIKVNFNLPECYNLYKEKVIKEAGSLPWILGSEAVLLELYECGALTEDTYEVIKGDWELVSNIPLETVYAIATGVYDISHDVKILRNQSDEMLELLKKCISMIGADLLPKEKIPFESIEKYIVDKIIMKQKISQEEFYVILGSLFDVKEYILSRERSKHEIMYAMQMYISYLILITK